jgi:cell division ATPase FtsA
MPILKFFNRKPKKRDFLVIEIGLEKIACAIFQREEESIKLVGVGRKKFSSQDEVFDSVLEALDSLAAIVPDFPPTGILGISGGSLETVTTVVRYSRQNPKKPMNSKETEDVLHKIVEDLDTKEKNIFFSTVAGAQIDGVKVSNPLGLKGEKVELSCLVSLKDSSEMGLLDRLMGEIDLKVEKIVPTSFAVAKSLEKKNLKDALIFRVGVDKSEITVLVDGHISEILPFGLGCRELELLPRSWKTAFSKIEKSKYPDLIWVFADNDQVDLQKTRELLENFNWKEELSLEVAPKIETAEGFQNFAASDAGIHALSRREVNE